MVKSVLRTRTIFTTDEDAPQTSPLAITRDDLPSDEALPAGSPSPIDPFNIGSFDLVRKFVAHVAAKNASASPGDGRSSRNAIDWKTVEASVVDSNSFEQAIGRAVVIADQMCRGVFDRTHPRDASSSLKTEEPFFTFSMVDVVPDFGDESRYRTKVARRVARIFRIRRTAVTLAVSLVLVVLSVTLYQVTHHGPSASASSRAMADSVLTRNAQVLNGAATVAAVALLPVTTAPPAAAPLSPADAALRPHKVSGFAPFGRSIRVLDST